VHSQYLPHTLTDAGVYALGVGLWLVAAYALVTDPSHWIFVANMLVAVGIGAFLTHRRHKVVR